MKAMIKCKMCGKKADLGFELENGKLVNVCNDCITELGGMKTDLKKSEEEWVSIRYPKREYVLYTKMRPAP